jgi:hypothetical protein
MPAPARFSELGAPEPHHPRLPTPPAPSKSLPSINAQGASDQSIDPAETDPSIQK